MPSTESYLDHRTFFLVLQQYIHMDIYNKLKSSMKELYLQDFQLRLNFTRIFLNLADVHENIAMKL